MDVKKRIFSSVNKKWVTALICIIFMGFLLETTYAESKFKYYFKCCFTGHPGGYSKKIRGIPKCSDAYANIDAGSMVVESHEENDDEKKHEDENTLEAPKGCSCNLM